MRARTHALLTQAATLYSVVVISGRAQPDVLRKLKGVGVHEVVGNHGIEPSFAIDRNASEVQRWRPSIDACVANLPGVSVEDKIFSVAVHYRQSRAKKSARAAILKMAATLGGERVICGKQVINILPRDAPHKGTALERERERLRLDTAIYVGDDETDEDVFALDQPGRLLTIRVGAKLTSAAAYYVRNQRAVDDLLALLIALRRGTARQRTSVR
jgi:trehalose 6-phosphate phosphatase